MAAVSLRARGPAIVAALVIPAVACQQAPASRDAARPRAPTSAGVSAEMADPNGRLSAALGEMPAEPSVRRNLFRFGHATSGERSADRRHGGPPDLPELPLPLPKPAIRVLGVATDDGADGSPPRRTAILSVGGELVLAPEGTLVAGRYRILSIGARDVQLVDETDQHVERLALR
jgi:hypothetical protein